MNGALHSYSGSDAKVLIHFDGAGEFATELDSVQTVSWQVYEAKGPARALGHRGVKGYARGIRTIAGSMILTVVGDNPLRPLLDMFYQALEKGIWPNHPGWSIDGGAVGAGTGANGTGNYWGNTGTLNDIRLQSFLATLMPPFNLSVIYSNEYVMGTEVVKGADGLDHTVYDWNSVAWRLSGVEFITEGIVTSINDSITEVTVQFVATDAYPLSLNKLNDSASQMADTRLQVKPSPPGRDQTADIKSGLKRTQQVS